MEVKSTSPKKRSKTRPLAASGTVHQHIDEQRWAYLRDLVRFLEIPSISTLPAHKPDMERAAAFVREQLTEAGMQRVRSIDLGGPPLVVGEWLGAPGKPTILIYGHYDVQPVDPLSEWQTPPFEPDIRDGNIYARGATDDKGQVLAMILAVRAQMATAGSLPVNVRFLIEGEEEYGGASIERYVREHADEIPCDAVLIADTHMLAPGQPSIVYGVRGMLYTELVARGAAHDLHSGTYGGVAPNPLHALALIIAGLKGVDGHINIPGLYELAQPVTDEERGWWARQPGDPVARLAAEMGVDVFPGEQDYSLPERMAARPTLEVHGFIGGFQQEGAKTVIPAEARAKVSLRLVPDQTAENVLPLLQARVAELTPPGVTVEVKNIHGGLGMVLDVHNPYVAAASAALAEEFGRATVFLREGGSIPIAPLFAAQLGAPVVFAGYGLADEGLHAPNEHFNLENFYHGIHGTVRFLQHVAEVTR
ncbi:MAG: dipeptidase [Ktedonobacterales bacterium]|nr:dipeptidase [Ktedonobacterales bacterium]